MPRFSTDKSIKVIIKETHEMVQSSLPAFEVELRQVRVGQLVVGRFLRVDEQNRFFHGSRFPAEEVSVSNNQVAVGTADDDLLQQKK